MKILIRAEHFVLLYVSQWDPVTQHHNVRLHRGPAVPRYRVLARRPRAVTATGRPQVVN